MVAKGKKTIRVWGGGRAYAGTKAGDYPDYVVKGRRSSKQLAHRLSRRVEKMRLWKS